ncbi:MAG: hypothetical protein FJZ92_03480 [Chloroflexi bacterium]|nr:hypothetical protein [Chloroflexota bacterium]
MPQYIAAQYGDRRRYLLKALREIAHRIEGLVVGLDEQVLSARPGDELHEEWCVNEIVGFLRDSEREDLRAIETMVERDGVPIAPRRAQHGPGETDYRHARVEPLVWDFMTLREETVWTLRAADSAWDHRGRDPYRGHVSLHEWVQEMNERDLDALWRIQRLVGHFSAAPRRRGA